MSKTTDAMVEELRELPENQWQVCGRCFFWRQEVSYLAGYEDDTTGLCRRYPPLATRGISKGLPLVANSEWCGEWKAVESLTATRLPMGIEEFQ